MANVTHFLRSLAPDELDDDLATSGRSRSSKRGGEAKSRSGSSKGKKKLRGYADQAYHFEVIPLEDDYSVVPSQEPENYFTAPHFERERSKHRAIRPAMTAACLYFGDHLRGAASIHCTVTDQSIEDAKLQHVDIAELRGLRLVLTGRCRNVIKTGYWLDTPSGRLAA